MNDDHRINLNYPTVVGGAVAAATAAALATRLGVVGTVLGAAVASVVSTVVTTALAHWIERLHGAVRDREPTRWRGVVVGALSIGLVVWAFHTGLGLVTQDLPAGGFTARLMASLRG
jgi:uncharacterized membrane protein